jgi:hypothetical protein
MITTNQVNEIKLYHGTQRTFATFDNKEALDGAHYFTVSREHAEHFGNVSEYTLSIKNTMTIDMIALYDRVTDDDVDNDILPRDYIATFIEEAKSKGYDSLHITDFEDIQLSADIYLPFNTDNIHPYAGPSLSTKETVENALYEALSESDDTLLSLLLEFKRSENRLIARDIFAQDLARFTVDSKNEKLAIISKREIVRLEKRSLPGQLKEMGDLTGVQVSNPTGTQGGFFLPDASEVGRCRLTIFNEDGFTGHVTRDTYDELIVSSAEYGFSKVEPDILEKMSSFESFSKGNVVASMIARLNEGKINYKKFLHLVKKIENSHGADDHLSPSLD